MNDGMRYQGRPGSAECNEIRAEQAAIGANGCLVSLLTLPVVALWRAARGYRR